MEETIVNIDLSVVERLISNNGNLLSAVNSSIAETNSLLAQNNELLAHVYASLLFVIGVSGASLVVFLLYKFLRKFF